MFFDPEAGILRKLTIRNEEKKSTFTFTLRDVQFNVEFEDDHFAFKPPEGAEIVDLTQPRPGEPSPPEEP